MPGTLEKCSCRLHRHRKSAPAARRLVSDCLADRPAGIGETVRAQIGGVR
ncbi:hypothetical protein ACFV84_27110 [Kitasatospora sp. NPDC059811]